MVREDADCRNLKSSQFQKGGLTATGGGSMGGGGLTGSVGYHSGRSHDNLLSGRYRVIQTIGRGTCGVCLLTEDQSSGQIVVIKRISVIKTSSAGERVAKPVYSL